METENEQINLEEKYKDIYNIFKDKGCKLTFFVKKTIKLKYICSCGIEKEKLYKDFMRNLQCKTCSTKKVKEKPIDEEYIDFESGETWNPIKGGWISDKGNAKNSSGKILTLCPTKFRYHIGGKNQYASRLVAEAFQIENYDKLDDPMYVVSHIDNNPSNNNIDNLKIVTKADIGSINGKKSRQSDTFKEKINWSKNHFDEDKDLYTDVIDELPNCIIYSNGEIWNGRNFSIFSQSGKYLNLKGIKVHRIICYTFNKIEGKDNLSDYDKLQVNHIDGNTLNNHADNLEWVTPSENLYHSYSTNLSKKVRNVLQFSLEGEFIKEFRSIAEASRETEEPEHRIREIAKGKKNREAMFLWKFKNDEESAEYTAKYTSV